MLRPASITFVIAATVGASFQAPMTGGGSVAITGSGDELGVSVTGPAAGLASLCVGDATRVRILHASAAVGEASYERQGDRWVRTTTFEWKLRDSPRTGSPTESQMREVFESLGWTANPSSAGSPRRTFRILLDERTQFLAVTFLSTAEPMAISYWPSTVSDDCRAVKVAQGYLPDTASFSPDTWQPLRSRD